MALHLSAPETPEPEPGLITELSIQETPEPGPGPVAEHHPISEIQEPEPEPVVEYTSTPETPASESEPVAYARASAGNSNLDRTLTFMDNEGPIVTRRELWSYYLYFSGGNGAGPVAFSMYLFQSLATSAGHNAGSLVLIANCVSFAIMAVIFITIAGAADYGAFGRWLLLGATVICWSAQFASISLTSPDRWGAAMALFMVGAISYAVTLVFVTAQFPRLARNTPHARLLRQKYERSEMSAAVFETEQSIEVNRINSFSTAHGAVGYAMVLLLNLTLLLPLMNDSKVDNYVLVLTNGYWVLTGIWWFIFQQPRPGPKLPKGEHYFTIGWKQIWQACIGYKRLRYTLLYLFVSLLFAFGLNTTDTLVSKCRSDNFELPLLLDTCLGLAQALASIISTLGFWYIQKYWKIGTKKLFVVTNVGTIIIPLWGMVGIWTTKLGFHNMWEFWAYAVIFGVFQAPFNVLSQTIMAELTPPGFDNMFFGLFGLTGQVSSMVGPSVIQAIIDRMQNNWMGFLFLLVLSLVASVITWFGVDVHKGRSDAVRFANEQREEILEKNTIDIVQYLADLLLS